MPRGKQKPAVPFSARPVTQEQLNACLSMLETRMQAMTATALREDRQPEANCDRPAPTLALNAHGLSAPQPQTLSDELDTLDAQIDGMFVTKSDTATFVEKLYGEYPLAPPPATPSVQAVEIKDILGRLHRLRYRLRALSEDYNAIRNALVSKT